MKTYQKLCTEFYDLEPHRDGAASQVFYLQQAMQARGVVLEPMCGTGRVLIPILQAGIAIEGFDASSYMLEALKQKCVALGIHQPPVRQLFVQDFKSDERYGLIFVPYGSWGLITDLQQSKKSLKIMYDHLAPGGRFIIEIETVASVPQPCGIWRRGIHTRSDRSKIAVNTLADYDEATQIFSAQCRYESMNLDGAIVDVEKEDFAMYLYHFNEMDSYLNEAGFTVLNKYQDYNLTQAIDKQTPIVIYECTK